MVNKALQGLICDEYGETTWREIREKAGFHDDIFITMNKYPDELTYKLVGVTSEVLEKDPAAILEDFGRYWTVFIGHQGYKELFDSSGRTISEFLMNLDNLHARVALSFPELDPPMFRCTEVRDNSLRLHYHSKRAGLNPFVKGLLIGLGHHFKCEVQVELDESASQDGHQQFLVNY